MTQAYNLSQLGNKVNTSGQLNPATGLSTQVPVANGGTGLATLTANNVILGNGTSAPTFVAPGTAGNALVSNGTTWISGAPTLSGTLIGYQVFTSTGTYTKATNNPAFVIVYVVGGGGGYDTGGGSGGTSSFGTFCSATGGTNASSLSSGGAVAGGLGSGGDLNLRGQYGSGVVFTTNSTRTGGGIGAFGLGYGNSGFRSYGGGKATGSGETPGGGGGAMKKILASAMASSETVTVGAAGSNVSGSTPNPTAGIVIVWEYQ